MKETKRKKSLRGMGVGKKIKKKKSKWGAIGTWGWGGERGEEKEGVGIREGNLGM